MIDTLLQPWTAFIVFAIVLFTIDLLFGQRGEDLRASILWSATWIAAGLAFGLWILAVRGGEAATAYHAAYLLEKSLSVDNIFVLVLIFSQLRVSAHQQHRVLLLGISALVMRAAMIWGGVYLFERFLLVHRSVAALLLVAARASCSAKMRNGASSKRAAPCVRHRSRESAPSAPCFSQDFS